MSKIELFSSLIYTASLNIPQKKKFNRELVDECYKLRAMDKEGQRWSKTKYLGGYTSYGSLANLHHWASSFAFLQKKINSHVQKFIKTLEYEVKDKDVSMTNFWVNIMGPQTVHTMHIHPQSLISGTYYLKIPRGAAGIKFEDPRLGFYMATLPKKENCHVKNKPFYTHHPKEGEIVLFESWMRHEVPPNPCDEDRISISFNYGWF